MVTNTPPLFFFCRHHYLTKFISKNYDRTVKPVHRCKICFSLTNEPRAFAELQRACLTAPFSSRSDFNTNFSRFGQLPPTSDERWASGNNTWIKTRINGFSDSMRDRRRWRINRAFTAAAAPAVECSNVHECKILIWAVNPQMGITVTSRGCFERNVLCGMLVVKKNWSIMLRAGFSVSSPQQTPHLTLPHLSLIANLFSRHYLSSITRGAGLQPYTGAEVDVSGPL